MLIIASLISACCPAPITASKGFLLRFSDLTIIQNVELIGANKVIPVDAPSVFLTLNPADTISSYRIFYEGGSGSLTLTYSGRLNFIDDDCEDENDLDVNYAIRSIHTSFLDATIGPPLIGGNGNEIYITR
ncbi:MAG: hypothetical protein MUE96_07805 [Bacteroidia bacterium]|jgi:hypothetical protein|nr:hypothetical protein [Bacteroidia bacterium]